MSKSGHKVIRKHTARQEIAKLYHSFLGDLDVLHLPVPLEWHNPCWHLFAPAFDFDRIGKSRKQVMAELADKSIGTQVHYIPLIVNPITVKITRLVDGAETHYRKTLSIPMYYGLYAEQTLAGVRSYRWLNDTSISSYYLCPSCNRSKTGFGHMAVCLLYESFKRTG